MLKELNTEEASEQSLWLAAFWKGSFVNATWAALVRVIPLRSFLNVFSFSLDFRRRFLSLLSYQFSSFHPSLALSILQNKKLKEATSKMFQYFMSRRGVIVHKNKCIYLIFLLLFALNKETFPPQFLSLS